MGDFLYVTFRSFEFFVLKNKVWPVNNIFSWYRRRQLRIKMLEAGFVDHLEYLKWYYAQKRIPKE